MRPCISRLVEDEHRAVREECARDRDPLTLPSRQLDAALADLRLVAAGQTDDELVSVRRLRRGDKLRIARPGPGIRDVLGDRGGEEHGILLDDGELPTEIGQSKLAQIGPVEFDMAIGRVVETREQAHERALACAGRAHDTEASAGFDGERDVVQHGTAWAIREGHMVKSDGAARARHGSCLRSLCDIQRLVEQRERPLRAGEVKLERGDLPADRPKWLVELVQVTHHQEQLAQGERAGEDVTDTDEQYRRRADSSGHSHDELVAPLESGEA